MAKLSFHILLFVLIMTSSVSQNYASRDMERRNEDNDVIKENNFTNIKDLPKTLSSAKTSSDTGQKPSLKTAYIAIISGSCFVIIIAIIALLSCWYRRCHGNHLNSENHHVTFRANDRTILIGGYNPLYGDVTISGTSTTSKLTEKLDYPTYGITGPNPNIEKSIDNSLTQEAELFHYKQTKKRLQQQQQQQQQLQASSDTSGIMKNFDSRLARTGDIIIGDEETSEGEFTVYECSGFASMTDEPLEVHNPFFDDLSPHKRAESIESRNYTSSSDISSSVMTSSPSPTSTPINELTATSLPTKIATK